MTIDILVQLHSNHYHFNARIHQAALALYSAAANAEQLMTEISHDPESPCKQLPPDGTLPQTTLRSQTLLHGRDPTTHSAPLHVLQLRPTLAYPHLLIICQCPVPSGSSSMADRFLCASNEQGQEFLFSLRALRATNLSLRENPQKTTTGRPSVFPFAHNVESTI